MNVTNVGKKTRCTKRKKNILPLEITFFFNNQQPLQQKKPYTTSNFWKI
jgi:hypothetical protein